MIIQSKHYFIYFGINLIELGKIRVKEALQAIVFFTKPLASNLYNPLLLDINSDIISNVSPGRIFLKNFILFASDKYKVFPLILGRVKIINEDI